MEDFVSCVKIAVYCVENDPENIALGEPKFLGFTFNVKRNELGYMKYYVEKELKRLEIPYDGIEVYGNVELPVVRVYDMKRITSELEKNKDFIIAKSIKHTK